MADPVRPADDPRVETIRSVISWAYARSVEPDRWDEALAALEGLAADLAQTKALLVRIAEGPLLGLERARLAALSLPTDRPSSRGWFGGPTGRRHDVSGTTLIAAERKRQRARNGEGRSASWDDQHTEGQLALAAAVYAVPPEHRDRSIRRLLWPGSNWPYRPPQDRIRELTKAGALIAAEIDRLQRAVAPPDGDAT